MSSNSRVVLRGATLLTTAAIGRLPTAMSTIALVRLVIDGGGTFGLAALLASIYAVTCTAGQPLLSRLVDRIGRPRIVIVVAALVAAACFAVVTWTMPGLPAVACVAVAVAGLAMPPLEPTLRAIWPRIMAPGRQLQRAFSADAAAQELMFASGPVIAAALIAAFGAPADVVLMGVIGLVGAAAFIAHPELRSAVPEAHATGGGHRSPLRIPAILRLSIILFLVGLPIGLLTISSSTLAKMAGDESLSGWALAINAFGAFCSALVIARWPVRASAARASRWFILSLALLYLPTALLWSPTWLWLVFAFLGGLSLPPLLTQAFILVEQISPVRMLTEANAWVVSAFNVGIAAGTLGSGLAADSAGPTGVVWSIVAASAIGFVAVALAAPRRLERAGAADDLDLVVRDDPAV